MPFIEIHHGVLTTQRFGDRVQVSIPSGGRVEIRPSQQHADVELRDATGAVVRQFRLPEEAQG